MKILNILILFFTCACSSNNTPEKVLYSAFPMLVEKAFDEAADIRFSSGPWHSPESQYGFVIYGEQAAMAYYKKGQLVSFIIDSPCEAIIKASKQLKQAIYLSSKKMFEENKTTSSYDVISLDGNRYQLSYSDVETMTGFNLSGGEYAKRQTSWIQASFALGDAIKSCHL